MQKLRFRRLPGIVKICVPVLELTKETTSSESGLCSRKVVDQNVSNFACICNGYSSSSARVISGYECVALLQASMGDVKIISIVWSECEVALQGGEVGTRGHKGLQILASNRLPWSFRAQMMTVTNKAARLRYTSDVKIGH